MVAGVLSLGGYSPFSAGLFYGHISPIRITVRTFVIPPQFFPCSHPSSVLCSHLPPITLTTLTLCARRRIKTHMANTAVVEVKFFDCLINRFFLGWDKIVVRGSNVYRNPCREVCGQFQAQMLSHLTSVLALGHRDQVAGPGITFQGPPSI